MVDSLSWIVDGVKNEEAGIIFGRTVMMYQRQEYGLMLIQSGLQPKVWATLVLSLLLVLSGCASQSSQTEYGAAKISSTPEGAEVVNLRDSSQLGVTPVLVSFAGEAERAEFVTIQFRKAGYMDRIATFWVNRRHLTVQEAEDNAIDIIVHLEKQSNN
jgi:hypothetical protein